MSRTFLTAGIALLLFSLVFAPFTTAASPAFIHTTDASNIISDPSLYSSGNHITSLDNPLTNGKPNQLVFVSQIYGEYNPHQIGVWYYNNRWTIYNQDKTKMPVNTKFSVLSLDPGTTKNAFQHRSTPTNTNAHITNIDHPLTNGNPNAFFLVTPIYGIYDTNPIGVWYDGTRWTVFHQNFQPMANNSLFNVLVLQDGANQIEGQPATAWVHQATPAAIEPGMPWVTSTTNTDKDAIPFLTQYWNPGSVYNDHIPALWYNGKWTVFNQDRVALPANAAFNVVALSSTAAPPPVRVELTFFNATSSKVNVYWINFSGQEQLYIELDASKSAQQETGFEHQWVVREAASGRELKRHIAKINEAVVITDGGGPPSPVDYTVTVTNNSTSTAIVFAKATPGAPPKFLGVVNASEKKDFPKQPDKTEITVTDNVTPVVATIQGQPLVMTYGTTGPPTPSSFAVIVANNSNSNLFATVTKTPGAPPEFLGSVPAKQTLPFAAQPTGAVVTVSDGTTPVIRTVQNVPLTVIYGSASPPPPVPTKYRVTVSLESFNVVEGGDGPGDPGDLYWNISVVRPSASGSASEESLSVRSRNRTFSVSNGRQYGASQISPQPSAFEIEAGQSFTIKGSLSEYDDFLRGGDDFFGDFTKTLTAPASGPKQETFPVHLVEPRPDAPPPGNITINFKVDFVPK